MSENTQNLIQKFIQFASATSSCVKTRSAVNFLHVSILLAIFLPFRDILLQNIMTTFPPEKNLVARNFYMEQKSIAR